MNKLKIQCLLILSVLQRIYSVCKLFYAWVMNLHASESLSGVRIHACIPDRQIVTSRASNDEHEDMTETSSIHP